MSKRLNRILNMQESLLENGIETRGVRAGKTFAEVDAVYRAGNGVCGICGRRRGIRNHALDHCHTTGKLRGILCHKCNVGLGYFNDDPKLLAQAIEYLKKYNG